jgi:hypothetical protein
MNVLRLPMQNTQMLKVAKFTNTGYRNLSMPLSRQLGIGK